MDIELFKSVCCKPITIKALAERFEITTEEVYKLTRENNIKLIPGRPQKHFMVDYDRAVSCECTENNPEEFYPDNASTCKRCLCKRNTARKAENAKRVHEYMGGRCICCGFSKYRSGMNLHHLDFRMKDEKFKNLTNWKWARIKSEIDKCAYVCACCHNAYHTGQLDYEGRKVLAEATLAKGFELPEDLREFSVAAVGVEPTTSCA